MNHCLLEVEVLEAPQLRYTQDSQTPVAEMTVRFDGLRVDDPSGQIRVVGWGSLAQDLQNRVEVGHRLVLEGRLRMNTVTRQDGLKEKRAEFIVSRLHPVGAAGPEAAGAALGAAGSAPVPAVAARPAAPPARRVEPVGRGSVAPAAGSARPAAAAPAPSAAQPPTWNSGPLVADPDEGFPPEDDIPF